MNYRACLLGVAVLALVPVAQAQTSDADKANALIKQADTAMREQRYADMVDPANQILALRSVTDTGRSIAYYMRGVGYWGQKKYQSCITDLSGRAKTTKYPEMEQSAQYWLGRCQVDAKRHDDAILTLGRLAGSLDSTNSFYSLAQLHLGRAWEGKGDWNKALAAVTKASESYPKWAWAWHNRCYYEYKLNQYDKAQADCRKALEISPGYKSAMKYLALSYRYDKKYAESLPQYDAYAAAAKNPDMTWINNEKSLSYIGLKDWPNAIAMAKAALAVKPDYKWAWYNQSVAQRESGDLEGAIASADRALAIDPEYIAALETKTKTQELLQDWSGMEATARKWQELRPSNKTAEFQVARAQLGGKKYTQCQAGFAKLTTDDPDYREAWNNLGACEYYLKNYAASSFAVGKALEMKPDDAMTNGNYGLALYKNGEYAKAIPYLQKAKDGGDPNKDVPRFLQYARDKVAAGQTVKVKTTKELFAEAEKMIGDKKYAEAEAAFASLLNDKRITTDADKMSLKEAQGVALHFQKKYCEAAELIEAAQGLKQTKTYVNLIAPAFECAMAKQKANDTQAEIRWGMATLDAAINAHKAGKKDGLVNQVVNVSNASYALCKDGKWRSTSASAKSMAAKWKGGTPLERATLARCVFDPMRTRMTSVRMSGSDSTLFSWRTTEQNLFNQLSLDADSKAQIRDYWKAGVGFFKLRYGQETALKNTSWSKLEKL